MTFRSAAINFVILMVAAFTILFIDLYFWMNGMTTFSETLWTINQRSLAVAFGSGIVCGHVFSVPRGKIN